MGTASAFQTRNDLTWRPLCTKADLIAHSGVAAWLEADDGATQVALFFLPGPNTPETDAQADEIYAMDNHDPFSGANVIARGIVGDIQGEPVIASPLYKQHYRLRDGACLEDSQIRLRHWPVRFDGDRVMIAIASGGIGPHMSVDHAGRSPGV